MLPKVRQLLNDQNNWCPLSDATERKYPGFLERAEKFGKIYYIPDHTKLQLARANITAKWLLDDIQVAKGNSSDKDIVVAVPNSERGLQTMELKYRLNRGLFHTASMVKEKYTNTEIMYIARKNTVTCSTIPITTEPPISPNATFAYVARSKLVEVYLGSNGLLGRGPRYCTSGLDTQARSIKSPTTVVLLFLSLGYFLIEGGM